MLQIFKNHRALRESASADFFEKYMGLLVRMFALPPAILAGPVTFIFNLSGNRVPVFGV